jgi:predicted transcriptional regulator
VTSSAPPEAHADAPEALDLAAIQRELKGYGITLKAFCARAGFRPSTWHRLKGEQYDPRAGTERRIRATLAEVRAENQSKVEERKRAQPPSAEARVG